MKLTWKFYDIEKRYQDRGVKPTWEDAYKELDGYFQAKQSISFQISDGDKCILQGEIPSSYDRCCGLREIGGIYIFDNSRLYEALELLISEMLALEIFENIGALMYVEVTYNHLHNITPPAFCASWPKITESCYGPWWYNPNSGHYCRCVTLPIWNSKKEFYSEDEEEDE